MKKWTVLTFVSIAVLSLSIFVVRRSGNKPSATSNAQQPLYVALGDSIAAGVGLETYSDSSACYRTNESYPNLIAKKLNYTLQNLACSGASIPVGLTGPQEVNNFVLSTQLEQLFTLPTPKLITMTIGANDAQWTALIIKCYSDTCGTTEDTSALNKRLTDMTAHLKSALGLIKAHYKTDAPNIAITSYYQVFPDKPGPNGCSDLSGIEASEVSWWQQQESALDEAIKQAATSYPDAKFVPVTFKGHELCTANSWVQGLSRKAPYHPTDAGQAEFAKQIEAAVK